MWFWHWWRREVNLPYLVPLPPILPRASYYFSILLSPFSPFTLGWKPPSHHSLSLNEKWCEFFFFARPFHDSKTRLFFFKAIFQIIYFLFITWMYGAKVFNDLFFRNLSIWNFIVSKAEKKNARAEG